jgi:hypothetical protein
VQVFNKRGETESFLFFDKEYADLMMEGALLIDKRYGMAEALRWLQTQHHDYHVRDHERSKK